MFCKINGVPSRMTPRFQHADQLVFGYYLLAMITSF